MGQAGDVNALEHPFAEGSREKKADQKAELLSARRTRRSCKLVNAKCRDAEILAISTPQVLLLGEQRGLFRFVLSVNV